jgi:hypothetical protein
MAAIGGLLTRLRSAVPHVFGQFSQAKSAAVMPAGWSDGHCTSSIL